MLYVRERRLWVWLAQGRERRRHDGHHGLFGQPQDHRQRSRIRAAERQAARHQEGPRDHEHHHPHARTTAGPVAPQRLRLAVRRAGAGRRALCLLALRRRDGRLREGHPAGAVPAAIWLGWFWRPLRVLALVVAAAAALLGHRRRYQGDLARADTVFWLKYFLSSQSRHPVDERAVLHEHAVLLDRLLRAASRTTPRTRIGSRPGLGGRLHGADRHAWCAGTKATRSARTSATSRSATCTKCSCCSAG